jgi:hypothetical protein
MSKLNIRLQMVIKTLALSYLILLLCFLAWYYIFEGGNHSLLFGTAFEAYLLEYPIIVSISPSLLYMLPLILETTRRNWLFAFVGVIVGFVTYLSIIQITD